MKVSLDGFAGSSLAPQARLLPRSVGVESVNQRPGKGDLRGWKVPLAVATVAAAQQTIIRFGRDTVSDTATWRAWSTVVHAVRSLKADDPTERTYFTGSGAPKITDNTSGFTVDRDMGVPAPVLVPTVTQITPGTGTTDETRYYVFTYVTDQGEESAPSPPSLAFVCRSGVTATIAGLGVSGPGGNYGIDRKRIYRTVVGQGGDTEYFFLREIAIGTASTTDDARTPGEVLVTQGNGVNRSWQPPPANLKHLTGLWNGMLAGISGRSVRYCEAYFPYAWPLAYELAPPDVTPIALAAFEQTLVVATTGQPIIVQGTAPDAMDDKKLELDAPCVSERSMQSMGHGACWASADGLAYVGSNGVRAIITADVLKRDDWQALNPSTIIGGQFEGWYVGWYTQGSVKGFMIDPRNPTGIYWLEAGYAASFYDRLQQALFVYSGTSIQKWNGGASWMTARFRSKAFVMPAPVNMGFGEVVADAYPVTFRLFADGVIKHTRSVVDRRPFTLPSGYLADDYQLEVEVPSGRAVQGAQVAESVAELKAS